MRCLCSLIILAAIAQASEPPTSWVDPDTADGKKMVYTTPDGISVLDLQTHAAKPVVQGKVRIIVTGRKTQSVYYLKDGAVFASDVDTGAAREIAKLPPRGSITTVNADETLLAGTFIEGEGRDYNSARPAGAQQL